MSAFIDTSAFYALLVSTEAQNAEVEAGFRKLLDSGTTLWTTSYVVLETVALLQHRLGPEPVRDFQNALVPVLTVSWVSQALHQLGFQRLIAEDRRSLSLVDCVSFEFMESEGLRDALALDADFAQAGFNLLC